MKRLFESTKHAQAYMKFRPTYPEEVADTILKYCKEGRNLQQTALDIGCGSGQSTLLLSPHFQQVVGIDASEAQIANAPKDCSNVSFRVGKAEDMSFQADDSVDLISVVQALHWLDTSAFYKEAKRVLRPGGVLAAFGYGNVKLDNKLASEAVTNFYRGPIGKYWDEKRGHIDNHYAHFTLPFSDSKRIDTIVMEKGMAISDFTGYLLTWSGYQAYMKQHPESDILEQLHKRLCTLYGHKNTESGEHTDEQLLAQWPIFMVLGRKT